MSQAETPLQFLDDVAGIALALTYLERIEQLERRLRELECQLAGL